MADNSTTTISLVESDNIFYVVNDAPVTYTYFTLNIFMIVAHIGSIALNSCMIEAIRRSRKVDEPGGHCLIGLSAAYIWHGFMMIYTAIYGLANMQQLEECLIRFGIVNSSFIIISWANCFLTIDRYLLIEFPFWYKKHMHIKTVWIANTIAAILAIFYGISTLIFGWYNPNEDHRRVNTCDYFEILPDLYLQIFYIITFSGIPLIVAAYIRLLYIARQHKLAVNQLPRSYPAKLAAKENKKKWRPVKIVLTICAIYIVCWAIPGIYGFIITLDQQYPKMEEVYLSVMAGLIMVPSLSGFINPCIYTLHRDVKKRFLEIIGCRKKRNNHFDASSDSVSSINTPSVTARIKRILTSHSKKTLVVKSSSLTALQISKRPINGKVLHAGISTDNVNSLDESVENGTVPSDKESNNEDVNVNGENDIEMTDLAEIQSCDDATTDLKLSVEDKTLESHQL